MQIDVPKHSSHIFINYIPTIFTPKYLLCKMFDLAEMLTLYKNYAVSMKNKSIKHKYAN